MVGPFDVSVKAVDNADIHKQTTQNITLARVGTRHDIRRVGLDANATALRLGSDTLSVPRVE